MSSLPPDPWVVLGITKAADKSEIRSAYKKLVLKCHPDKVQDPTLKAQKQDEFQKVQQAYELLNDDVERAKYEDQVKVHELRKKMAKNMPNTSASRTPPMKSYATFDARPSPEPRHKPAAQPAPPATKIYYTTHSRSHEDATRSYEVYEASPRTARRTASAEYPKSTPRREREEDRRDRDRDRDRDRRRREDEDRERDRQQARKESKKRSDKERKQASEEKTRRHREPYVENFPADADEVYLAAPKSEKKKSSSGKKNDEPRERERSTRRGERGESPKIEPRKQKTDEYIEYAASYIERSKAKLNATAAAYGDYSKYSPPTAPSPPPMDYEEESIRRSSARAARRMSNDTPKKEKSSSRRQASKEDIDVVNTAPRIPPLSKSHTAPIGQMPTGSPPRVSRSNTAQDAYTRTMQQPPTFSRSNTWNVGEEDRTSRNTYTVPTPVYEYESEDEQPRRSHRSRRSHEPAVRYRVGDDNKTSKIDSAYAYGESPPSRRYASGLGRSPTTTFTDAGYKVKTAPHYSVQDVKYGDLAHSTSSYPYREDLSAY